MKMIRAFFAIMPPKSTHESFSDFLALVKTRLPKGYIQWTEIEKLHVTLKFVQSLPEEKIATLIERLEIELKCIPAFRLELNHLEWFPSQDHPKILSLAVGLLEILSMLSNTISKILIELDLSFETLPFRPHMTIGRLDKNVILIEDISKIPAPNISTIYIDRIYLMESKFYNGKTSYHSLAKFDLKCVF